MIVDNTKPKVTKTVMISVSATDRNGINRVELLVNGKVVAKDTKASYARTWRR